MESSQSELEMHVTTWITKSEVEEFDREDTELHHSQKLRIDES